MTLYEFNALPEDKKAEATWNGTFLMHRENEDIRYALYSVDTFFVEVTYNSIKNKITRFKSFKTKRLLEEYLKSIKLEF